MERLLLTLEQRYMDVMIENSKQIGMLKGRISWLERRLSVSEQVEPRSRVLKIDFRNKLYKK